MDWIRNISLVRRVVIGFTLMAAWSASLGAAAVWALPKGQVAWAIGVAAAAGCMVALLAGWMIRSSIKDSVESTVRRVIRIAGGDLETKIESPGKDEISWLRAELNGMRKKLRKMVLEVRQTVGRREHRVGGDRPGNTDLSTRTESQASALQQTASSMQQLADTVRSNAENTHEAREEVAQSSAVAARGAQTMQDVVVAHGRDQRERHAHRRDHRRDRRHRLPDQHPGAERRRRSGACRRARPRLRGGGLRGAQPGAAQLHRGARDQDADRRLAPPRSTPAPSWSTTPAARCRRSSTA